jgi:hypothetical protein
VKLAHEPRGEAVRHNACFLDATDTEHRDVLDVHYAGKAASVDDPVLTKNRL